MRVSLGHREPLAEANVPIQFVYFLENGIASIVHMFEDGTESETGIVGCEGMSGPSVVVGGNQTPFRTYMQLDGTASLRIGMHDLLHAIRDVPAFAKVLQNYVQVVAVQVGRTAAVNAHFDIPHRLARWLLMCHDRVADDNLDITHESLAVMLGVRRPGVTVALQAIEALGLIWGARGRIAITDRTGLQQFAEGAYGTPEKEYRRLIGPFGKNE